MIAVKWRPRQFLPAPFRAGKAQNRILVKPASTASYLLPDVVDILETTRAMGGALVKRIRAV